MTFKTVEARRAYGREYYRRTKDKAAAYYQANRDTYAARGRKYRAARWSHILTVQRRWNATPAGRVRRLLSLARRRDAARGWAYDLSPDDVRIPETCPVLGTPMSLEKDAPPENRPSIDRIDNSKGYTRSNVAIISQKANSWKNDMTADHVRALLRYMEVAEILA